jgi:hypothetical protein
MNFTTAGRRIVFAVIVCALAGLGAYLLSTARGGPGGQAANHPAAVASGGARPGPSTSPADGTTAAGQGGADQGGLGGAQPDIYQWLPFTQQGLAAAADVAVRFGDAYGSYSYAGTPAAYIATLQPVTSGQLAQQIDAAFTAPGVTAARTSGKQVSVGTATIQSIRAFGPTSLTFVLQVSQQLSSTTGRSVVTTVYAATLTGTGTSWQVSSIELASVGNS